MLNLAQRFSQLGICADLVLASDTEGADGYQIPSGVRVIDLKASRPLAALPGVVRYLRTEHPDALVSALTPANLLAVWARRISGVKSRIVVNVPVSVSLAATTTPFRARLRPFAYRAFYPWADAVVAVSQGVAEDLEKFGLPESKIRVIYNPVVTRHLQEKAHEPVDHPWLSWGEPPVILGAGRLHKQKDFPTLIRAFAFVRQKRPAKLVILGEGEERPRLEGLVRELGFERDVDLPGFVENPYAYMKRAAVFVLSSAWEGFGNVLAEAMAVGTPVLSTDCPSGPAEILERGRWGRLVPVGDALTLSEAIADTLDTPPDRLALRRRAQAFSVDVIVPKYLEVTGIGHGPHAR